MGLRTTAVICLQLLIPEFTGLQTTAFPGRRQIQVFRFIILHTLLQEVQIFLRVQQMVFTSQRTMEETGI
jgi:hypothetical protein